MDMYQANRDKCKRLPFVKDVSKTYTHIYIYMYSFIIYNMIARSIYLCFEGAVWYIGLSEGEGQIDCLWQLVYLISRA